METTMLSRRFSQIKGRRSLMAHRQCSRRHIPSSKVPHPLMNLILNLDRSTTLQPPRTTCMGTDPLLSNTALTPRCKALKIFYPDQSRKWRPLHLKLIQSRTEINTNRISTSNLIVAAPINFNKGTCCNNNSSK